MLPCPALRPAPLRPFPHQCMPFIIESTLHTELVLMWYTEMHYSTRKDFSFSAHKSSILKLRSLAHKAIRSKWRSGDLAALDNADIEQHLTLQMSRQVLIFLWSLPASHKTQQSQVEVKVQYCTWGLHKRHRHASLRYEESTAELQLFRVLHKVFQLGLFEFFINLDFDTF